MQKFKTLSTSRQVLFIGGAVLALSLIWPLIGAAQDKSDDAAQDPDAHAQHKDAQPPGDQTLASQIAELRAKVAKLEAALKQNHKGMPSGSPDKGGLAGTQDNTGGDPADRGTNQHEKTGVDAKQPAGSMGMMGKKKAAGMGMMDMGPQKGMGGMGADKGGMMDQQMMQMMQMMQQMMEMKMMEMKMGKGMGSDMSGMKGMQTQGMKGMEMGKKGMKMMGKKGRAMMGGKGMATMQTPAALPAFPGASQIYHIGSTGFFLDHAEHITLTIEQQTALDQAKENGLLEQASFQQKIDDVEQELGTLTSSDKPDVTKIDAKVRAIEKLRGDQRLAFIRSVGEAANVLTSEQRKILVGTLPPNHAAGTDKQH